MANTYSAQQFDDAFRPSRLSNWEVPAFRASTPLARPPGFQTVPIVDDNGHILRDVPKRLTSFTTGYEGKVQGRWPVSATAPFGGASTMGYKGIQTSYLPSSTTFLRNNPDNDERNVSEPPRALSLACRPLRTIHGIASPRIVPLLTACLCERSQYQ